MFAAYWLKIQQYESEKDTGNFSVKDAKRTNQFYTQLGFTPNKPNNDPKLASFLFGDGDFGLIFLNGVHKQMNI